MEKSREWVVEAPIASFTDGIPRALSTSISRSTFRPVLVGE